MNETAAAEIEEARRLASLTGSEYLRDQLLILAADLQQKQQNQAILQSTVPNGIHTTAARPSSFIGRHVYPSRPSAAVNGANWSCEEALRTLPPPPPPGTPCNYSRRQLASPFDTRWRVHEERADYSDYSSAGDFLSTGSSLGLLDTPVSDVCPTDVMTTNTSTNSSITSSYHSRISPLPSSATPSFGTTSGSRMGLFPRTPRQAEQRAILQSGRTGLLGLPAPPPPPPAPQHHVLPALKYGMALGSPLVPSSSFHTLTNFSWEQSLTHVKVYVPLRGVQTELLHSTFEPTRVEIKVFNLQGKNYVFSIDPPFRPINPNGCEAVASKTKKNILITLKKLSSFTAEDRQWAELKGTGP